MKGIRLLILTAFLLASCSSLPVIKPLEPQARPKFSSCTAPFLKEPYRLVHVIEAQVAGESPGAIIGITLADPSTGFISCAVMTPEGMVLLEAQATPTLEVIRALPPFDSGDLAKNLIEDIKLIFLAPDGEIRAKGILSDGAEICRWRQKSDGWIDVIDRQPEGIEINKYSSYGRWQRRIRLKSTAENAYSRIELAAKETFNYFLIMTLIEAEPLESELKKERSKGSAE